MALKCIRKLVLVTLLLLSSAFYCYSQEPSQQPQPSTQENLTKLEDYAKFAEDEELRKKLFKETEIAARIFDTESKTVSREEVARFLLENLVSCKLMADNLGADYYEVDAEKGTCELVKVPEAN